MSSHLYLLILHTVLALFLEGLITRGQEAMLVTGAVVWTFLAAFVLQALLKKSIACDIRVISA